MENMVVDQVFWQNKRVLITGHTGFKGSWLSLWLQKLGSEVIGYALTPSSSPSMFNETNVAVEMQSIIGDIRDFEAIKKALVSTKPEIIIHMAAQPLVRRSYIDPIETYSTNVMGTVHLLEAARHSDTVKAIVNVTSDKCYENKELLRGYIENDQMGGYDPYSNSKACSELISSAYRSSFMNPNQYADHGIALATARAGNVIGGGDWSEDRLIPDIIKKLLANNPITLRNPHAIRPWQHVLEPLSGYLKLAQRLYENTSSVAEAWNFGPEADDAKSVEWITKELIKAWGENTSYLTHVSEQHLHETNTLKLDCTKSKNKLGWKPKWNTEQVLTKICAWHKAHISDKNMKDYTLNEISEYEHIA